LISKSTIGGGYLWEGNRITVEGISIGCSKKEEEETTNK